MSLSLDDVKRIAQLSRIELPAHDLEPTRTQLNSIFGFIEQLQAAPTDGVLPMSHAVDLSQRLRADEVTESDRSKDFQALSVDAEDGLYLVPKVIE
jgi:aspartyl-tRNA(Asn)/glutamyl-tRNA(Gln) amidotransferase subunit C